MSFAYVPDGRSSPAATGLFTARDYRHMRAFFAAHPELTPSPARNLPALARHLGIRSLMAKDETARFGLNAFKLLGARFAIDALLSDGLVDPGTTLACASEGNHGRAVARAARAAGCRCQVFMAGDAAQARVDAIAGEGATVVRVHGSYDDAVRIMEEEASAHGWVVVSDTSWPGYDDIPVRIMLGYTRMMDEVAAALASPPPAASQSIPVPDAVFVQGGVGGLLCAIASWCAMHWPGGPRIVCVEPVDAACLLASARAGRPVAVDGPLDTTMAGLRNREVSPLAFDALQPIVDAYVAIDDQWAHRAMRMLARPLGDDPSIAAGASGAAALGGLAAVLEDPSLEPVRQRFGLGPSSRVLVLVTEGATDPALWASVVARP